MPVVYANGGLKIVLNVKEKGHNKKHVHVFYRDIEASFDFEGNQLNGKRLPRKIEKEVLWYINGHKETLETKWKEYN